VPDREGGAVVIAMSCSITGGDFESAGLATRKLKEQLARIGVDAGAMRRAMIASYEAEMNVVIHARTGTLWARLEGGKLDLEIADEGPGIPDVEAAMREGWSTASKQAKDMGFGAGLGLPNIRRSSDLFEIETRVGRGTRIRSTILLGPSEPDPRRAGAGPVAAALSIEAGRCRGCLRCIFACPSAALRVRDAGPLLLPELCVGCTGCIAECPDSVYGIADPGEGLPEARADAVLVVPRGFLSGFPVPDSPARVLAALKRLGFAEVRLAEEWEEALRAEARAQAGSVPGQAPIIMPMCPSVVAFVESRFPSLIPLLGPWLSPVEAAGEEFPLRPVVLVAACPSQFSATGRSSITGRLTVVSAARMARAVLPLLAAPDARDPDSARVAGCAAPLPVHAPCGAPAPGELAVSGLRNVTKILAALETGAFSASAGAFTAGGALGATSILELAMCDGGCAGSPLLSADPALSRLRWRQAAAAETPAAPSNAAAVRRGSPYAQRHGVRLDPDMGTAIRRLSEIDALTRELPGRDCGACGAPGCGAFAEDVVMGRAERARCTQEARS
jgi:serine/threonine-protein kinase RsbT